MRHLRPFLGGGITESTIFGRLMLINNQTLNFGGKNAPKMQKVSWTTIKTKTKIYLQSSRLNGGSVGQLCRGGFTLDTDQGFLNRVHPVFKGTEQDFL